MDANFLFFFLHMRKGMLWVACLIEHGLWIQNLEIKSLLDLLILGSILNPLTSGSAFIKQKKTCLLPRFL